MGWLEIKKAMRTRSYLFALILATILFVANVIALPQFVSQVSVCENIRARDHEHIAR